MVVAFLQVVVNGLRVAGAPCRQPPAPLRVLRTGARSPGIVLRQSVLPGAQEAPPAVDALFDLFEFAFSPAGLAAVFGLIALGFLWDFATAVDNRTLLGQKRQTSVSILGQTYSTDSVDAPSRFAIKFSATVDGFYESPSGGAERVEAGVAYVEEFDDLSACVALGKALQRRFGKDKVEFQTFEVRGSDWMERKASSAALTGKKKPDAAAKPPQAQDQAQDSAQTDTASEDPVDQEWRSIMEKSKLLKQTGAERTVISGENACRLCNGRGYRGCSTCSTPSNVGDDDTLAARIARATQGVGGAGLSGGGLGACAVCRYAGRG